MGILYSENIITIFWRYNNPAPTLRKENLIFKALKWKSTFHQKIADWLVITIQNPVLGWKAYEERIHLRVFSTWGIGQRGHMRSTFSKKHEKGKCYKKDVRNPTPWFLQFWAFQALRIVRIDPSRQVSMDAARMGFPSATKALNKFENINRNKQWRFRG